MTDMEKVLHRLTTNRIRRERLHGREFIVATGTILREGVLNGSKGRLYYPADEIAADVQAWNGFPIVVYHPTKNYDGQAVPVSARDPEVADVSEIGRVYRARMVGTNRLRAELWFDSDLMKSRFSSLYARIQSGNPIELSTGLFTQDDPAPRGSSFGGRPYDFIARNYRPDHLAILPDQRGACSVDDGCGVNVNAAGDKRKKKPSKVLDMTTDKACKIVEDGEVHGKKLTKAQRGMFGAKCGERDMKRNASKPAGGSTTMECPECGGKMKKGKKCRCGHKEPAAAEPKDETTTNRNQPRNDGNINPGDDSMKLTPEQRRGHVTYLTANCECWKGGKDDETVLNSLTDEKLAKLVEATKKSKEAEAVASAARAGFGTLAANADATQLADAVKVATGKAATDAKAAADKIEADRKAMEAQVQNATKQKTLEEWMAEAPPQIQQLVKNAERVNNREKQAVIQRIVANVQDDSKRQAKAKSLMSKSMEELLEIADLIPAVNTDSRGPDEPGEYDNSHLALTPFAPDVALSANKNHDGEKEALLPFTINSEPDEDPIRKRLRAMVG